MVNVCVAVPPAVVIVTVRAPRSAAASTVNRAVSEEVETTLTSLTLTPVPDTTTVVAPLMKPEPLSVDVTVVADAALLGVIDVNARLGAVTVNVTALLVPLAVVIVNVRAPSAASAAIATVAVAVVAFWTAALLMERPVPLNANVGATPPDPKLLPVTVTFTVVPGLPDDGEIAVNCGGVEDGDDGELLSLQALTAIAVNRINKMAVRLISITKDILFVN
jgi:hypothetical protein